jgi:hypothetical protein
MKKTKTIKPGYLLPSAAYVMPRKRIVYRERLDKPPVVGDLVYGSMIYIGQHKSLENREGRIHTIYDGSKAVFVYGNRYAPDMFEGYVPDEFDNQADLLARSGIIGKLKSKNTKVSDCSRVKVYGYVCGKDGTVINTRDFPIIETVTDPKPGKKAKLILVVGTAMNSGKSQAAACCCWSLSTMGHKVNACKVTGTASLKDILLMEDCGAQNISDFSFLGYPSTFMLSEEELFKIFWSLDARYGSHNGYWVVEFADGILQRETAMLLGNELIRQRIEKLIFCSHDALGAIGGLKVLKDCYGLVPDGISGLCASSPLALKELKGFTDIPFFDSTKRDLDLMATLIS